MTYETNAVTDPIDARIRIIATEAISGARDEIDARWAILAELAEAGIWESVARSTPDIDQQLRADLTDHLFQLIETKIVHQGNIGYDLRRALDTSPCGFARQMSRTAVASELRNIRARSKDVSVDPLTYPSDDGAVSVGANRSATKSFHNHSDETPSAMDELDDLSAETLLESFNEMASGTRSSLRLHISAAALRDQYNVPEAIRPSGFVEREWVRAELEKNQQLARNSIAAMRALIVSTESAENLEVDDKLLALWADFSDEQMELIAGKPAGVAHTMALSAVAGQPKPSRDAIDQTVSLMVMVSGMDETRALSREFRPVAKQLVASWAASECEAVSDFNTKSAAAALSAEKEMQRLSDALSWTSVAAEAAALPGAPFGTSEEAVSAWIGTAIRAFSKGAAVVPAELVFNA